MSAPLPTLGLTRRPLPQLVFFMGREILGTARLKLLKVPKVPLPVSGSRLCLYEDGTEVTDDYFPGLPNQATELLLLTAGKTWQGFQLLSDEQAPQGRSCWLTSCIMSTSTSLLRPGSRTQSWFEGLESRFRNKSGYLRYSCESRIRGYLREVSAHTSVVDAEAREEFELVLGSMCQKLKSQKYNGSYFDREKKRTVVPTLAEAVQDGRQVNWEYFYSLLFMAENPKLVHIACHKKTTHKLQCDPSKIYPPQAGSKKKRPACTRR
ncbi:DNA fragmentation factor subunit beta [Microtus ochrogaster]|uniref:DNAation factor subunit beta n=1 Tax=Microtus ochrogaster TaxID=79684 RepID=A0A8J6L2R8_MICOH|nr:DNA fragmentation factor subunit beta [Microtus ochrogaster]